MIRVILHRDLILMELKSTTAGIPRKRYILGVVELLSSTSTS